MALIFLPLWIWKEHVERMDDREIPKIRLLYKPIGRRDPGRSRQRWPLFLLFNDGHVLQLWSETVAVRRQMNMVWMIYDGYMKTGDECMYF